VLPIVLSLVLSALQAPAQRPGQDRLRFPPSTMSSPVYVKLPITIEIVNMTPQVLSDLVASGKIAVDGANHLNIPSGPMVARLGPDMLRPEAQGERLPATSADRPLSRPADRPVLVSAPAKFTLITTGKPTLTVQGSRIVLK
jgi:hypothetical protein